MKQSLLNRVLTGLSGLILVILGIGLFVYGVGIFPFQLDMTFLEGPFTIWQHLLMTAVALVFLLLGMCGVAAIFRSNREKGFILQRTEYGDLNISMNAMENMVKKVVDMNDELKVNHTKISHTKDGVIVSVRVLLENGVNIPMIVSALQKHIRQYITSCSGVDVKEVRVFVDTSVHTGAKAKGGKPTEIAAADADAAEKAGRMVDRLNDAVQKAIQADAAPPKKPEETKEPLHQRIFRKKEEEQAAETDEAEPTEEAASPVEDVKGKAPKTAKKKAAEKPSGDPHDKEDA